MLKQLNLKAARGYGLAMLMVFLGTTVMIGASLQIMATPLTLAYLGGVSQDNMSAQQLAAVGMDLAVADLQSKYDNGQTIDTSYSFTSAANAPSSVLMPQSPDAVTGATSSVGSYTASLPYVNGNTALVSVTATVGSGTYTMSKVVTLSKGIFNTITGATAAYSVRKLNPAYNGSALRVRRTSDDAETDIGFDSRGNLDRAALRAFAGTTLPLNSVSGALRAYSLRKLRAAYAGSAIRVRRSSDNAETDIGFTLSGDLDLSALTDFVGTDSGYITTWYDQSGNGSNATQTTAASQPAIILSGVLQTIDGKPAIKYDGTDDALRFSRGSIGGDFTILANYSAVAGIGPSTNTQWYQHAGLVDMEVSGTANDFGTSIDNTGNIFAGTGNPDRSIYISSPGYNDLRMHWMAFTRTQSSGYYNLYTEQGSRSGPDSGGAGNTGSLTDGGFVSIGQKQSGTTYTLNGYIPEVIVYTSVLSDANRKTLQQNAARYWNVPTNNNVARPLAVVGSAKGAYGLRRLRSSNTAIRVRRSSDNAEKDINFLNDDLDIVDLKNFVGNGSGYVTTWYDQSNPGVNDKHLTQTTPSAQPRIVNAGTVETLNGKPTLVFDGVDDALFNASMTGHITGTDISSYIVGATNTGIWPRVVVLHKTGDSYEYSTTTSMQLLSLGGDPNSLQAHTNNVGAYAYNSVTPNLLFQASTYHDSTNTRVYVNGSFQVEQPVANNLAPDYLVVGAGRNGSTLNQYLNGKISEILIYNTAHSDANRMSLETNQLRYFSPPPQALYVTKWYDQSGNGNNLAQNNPYYQPTLLLSSDGTLQNRPTVLFNGSNTPGLFGAFMDSTTGFPTNSDYSISAVYSYRTQALMNNVFSCSGGNHAFYMAGGNTLKLYHNTAFATSPTNMSLNTLYAVLGTYVESSKLGSVYVGPNAVAGTGTAPVSNSSADIRMGSHGNGSVFHGTISEAIVYNKVLSATERTNLYNAQTTYFGAQ